jgi:hypothetical protein
MGREQAAREQRSELRRAVVDEAIARVGEFELRLDEARKVVNQQGKALEALANVVSNVLQEQAHLRARADRLEELINRSWYFRLLASWRARRHPEPLEKLPASVKVAKAEDHVEIRVLPSEEPPAPTHLHQYVKDGLCYRCTVDGCGKVSTLEDIAAESNYLQELAANG